MTVKHVFLCKPSGTCGPDSWKINRLRDTYDASLLQGVPRSLNRDPLGLKADNLPFHGTDIWTLYELSG